MRGTVTGRHCRPAFRRDCRSITLHPGDEWGNGGVRWAPMSRFRRPSTRHGLSAARYFPDTSSANCTMYPSGSFTANSRIPYGMVVNGIVTVARVAIDACRASMPFTLM